MAKLLPTLLSFLLLGLASAKPPGTPHYRDFFYVGETFVPADNSSIAAGQIYVEHLTPASGPSKKYPILFVHGAGMTGTNFLNTPDGREGWADYFLGAGYEVYIVDQPSRGRSPWQQTVDGQQASFNSFVVESRFTATAKYGLWPNSTLHNQWPGPGTLGDPVYNKFYTSIVPLLINDTETATKVNNALVALLDNIQKPVVLLTHSQSGLFNWPLADSRPKLVKAIVTLEPGGPPFLGDIFTPTVFSRPWGLTNIPMTFDPPVKDPSEIKTINVTGEFPGMYTCVQQAPPARQWPNLKKIPVLTVTSETGYHGIFDDCTVRFVREAGVHVDFIRLQNAGFHGNGHMFFMEKNSIDIAKKVVEPWIGKL
ncbi:Alpha/Beta hydrolase protein [Flagelloscypha sp. PMI_526]|nr:Alpha/Beta hydrolase protein [Flagelloscypha sp. PMI_526]